MPKTAASPARITKMLEQLHYLAANASQRDIAKRLGYSASYINALLGGKNRNSPSIKLCNRVNTLWKEMTERAETAKPSPVLPFTRGRETNGPKRAHLKMALTYISKAVEELEREQENLQGLERMGIEALREQLVRYRDSYLQYQN